MSFDRDTWATPQYLFSWLNEIYAFDIDLCANEENSKCEEYFDIKDNSLIQAWGDYGSVGFCNPPYSNIKPWIEKAIKEAKKGFTTVMLIPTPNGESCYKDVFTFATKITFITGRIAFYNPVEMREVGGNTRGSCVVEFSRKFELSAPITNHYLRDSIKELYK